MWVMDPTRGKKKKKLVRKENSGCTPSHLSPSLSFSLPRTALIHEEAFGFIYLFFLLLLLLFLDPGGGKEKEGCKRGSHRKGKEAEVCLCFPIFLL